MSTWESQLAEARRRHPDDVFRPLIAVTSEFLNVPIAGLWHTPEQRDPVLEAGTGLPQDSEPVEVFSNLLRKTVDQYPDGVFVVDAERDSGPLAGMADAIGVRGIACIPIEGPDQHVDGFLLAGDRRARKWTEEERDILHELGRAAESLSRRERMADGDQS